MSRSARAPQPVGPVGQVPGPPARPAAEHRAGQHDAGEHDAGDLFFAQLQAACPSYDRVTAQRLHRRLETDAERDGLIEVAYRRIDSAVGPLLLAATTVGVVRVAFAVEDHDRVLAELAVRIGPRIIEAPARLDELSRQLDAYFDGRIDRFELTVDFRLAGGFRREVLQFLATTAYGCTYSYAEIADAVGRPRAARAVGTACARNPVPLVVPCHRVVRSDGSPGGYLGGATAKALLLGLEAQR